jgi:hypothetical protein
MLTIVTPGAGQQGLSGSATPSSSPGGGFSFASCSEYEDHSRARSPAQDLNRHHHWPQNRGVRRDHARRSCSDAQDARRVRPRTIGPDRIWACLVRSTSLRCQASSPAHDRHKSHTGINHRICIPTGADGSPPIGTAPRRRGWWIAGHSRLWPAIHHPGPSRIGSREAAGFTTHIWSYRALFERPDRAGADGTHGMAH